MNRFKVIRQDSPFVSCGQRCAAWLFQPISESQETLPVVVMAHGFAAQRSFGLPRYAERFAAAGLAVLLFDYRHFGDSEGEPRDMVDHRRQHNDWLAAIKHVATIDRIDSKRIGLWGSSFSGGHVISIAAEVSAVKAICSQAPMVDIPRASRINAWYFIRALRHITADYLNVMLGRPPHYIPTVSTPDQFAAMNQPGSEAGYRSIIPADADWQNRCTARSLWTSLSFQPSKQAANVLCPALLVIAEHDQVIRARVIEQTANRMPDATVLRYPVGHFEIYEGQLFEEISKAQTQFLVRHLTAVPKRDQ